MSQHKVKEAKGDPKFIVYVVAVTSIKIYSTDDADTAKERATEIVREALRQQDNLVQIPRCLVQPYGVSMEEIQDAMRQSGVDPEALS